MTSRGAPPISARRICATSSNTLSRRRRPGLPSGKPRAVRIAEALPKRVSAVLAQRLFVEKAGLASPLLNQDQAPRRCPEPRVLQEAEHAPVHRDDTARDQLRARSAATRGAPADCRSELALEELLRGHGVSLDVEDQRAKGTTLDLRFQGTLTAVQEQAARALVAHDTGIFVAPPGFSFRARASQYMRSTVAGRRSRSPLCELCEGSCGAGEHRG